MASVVQLPKFKAWVPVTGVPAASYCLRTYAAGTTTNQAVYTDAACTISAANPVVLDANGEAILYAVAGTLYKFSLYDPTNTTQQGGWPVDNVTIYGGGTGGGGGGSSVSEWIPSGLVPAYISGTSFSFPVAAGNLTSTYTTGRVLQTTNTSGTVYSTVVSSSFGTFTTVTVTPYLPGGTALDSGLSVVNVAALGALNPSSPEKSIVAVSYAHNSDALTTGAIVALSTANGFALNSVLPFNSLVPAEFSTATGTFTATRAGFYQVNVGVALTSTGVTFNGTTRFNFTTGGSTQIISNSGVNLSAGAAGTNLISGYGSFLAYFPAAGTIVPTVTATFSAGTPVFSAGSLSIVGPL